MKKPKLNKLAENKKETGLIKKLAEKIEIRKGKIISSNELFRRKTQYHKKLSRLSFKKKIEILMQLWDIARSSKKISRVY